MAAKNKLKKIKHVAGEKASWRQKIARILKLTIVLGVLILLWRGWEYTKPSNFPIKHVKIAATYEHVNRAALQAIVNPYLSNGFFYLNVIGLKRQLLQLPWVARVAIQRQWPDMVRINIAEEQPIAQWGNNALLNADGAMFTVPAAEFPPGLPVLFGPNEQALQIFNYWQQMQQLFATLHFAVKQLLFNEQHYWEILLDNGTVVYFKEAEPVKQLESLVMIYPKISLDHNSAPKAIDMRYSSGLAVQW